MVGWFLRYGNCAGLVAFPRTSFQKVETCSPWGKVSAVSIEVWKRFQERLNVKGVGTQQRAVWIQDLATHIGVTPRTIRNWLTDHSPLTGTSAYHLPAISRFLSKTFGPSTPFGQISAGVYAAMDIEHDYRTLSEIKGSYKTYRLGIDEKFIEGECEIFFDIASNCWLNKQMSVQTFNSGMSSGTEEFTHTGPTFLVNNRLYLIGCGINRQARYIRNIILRIPDTIRYRPAYGIILTEQHPTHRPMASTIAFVSEGNSRRDDPEFLEEIYSALALPTNGSVSLKSIAVD